MYKLDYGCYVDLINTDKYPVGMLLGDNPDVFVHFDVPDDDGRSYRRAILDLERFYAATGVSPTLEGPTREGSTP